MNRWNMLSAAATNFDQNWCGLPSTNDLDHKIEIKSESNPVSPHSLASDESLDQSIHNDNVHPLMNRNNPAFGFDPLTPPGNQSLYGIQQDKNMPTTHCPTTPVNHFSVSELAFSSVPVTPNQTLPGNQTPPKSPKSQSDASEKDCNENDNSSVSGDEAKSLCSDYDQEISVPKFNSHGKMKLHRCKHCIFVASTKKDFWCHLRKHIKPERQILCSKCPFVTEFKHHFEYHLRNHDGSKPYKCPECNYTCVNKSMLNSHLKSHSDIFQYRCEDCCYATKYIHSLKLHLRKYGHHPAPTREVEVIDVYGTRRGPKKRTSKAKRTQKARKVENTENIIASVALEPQDLSPQKQQPQQLEQQQQHQQQHQQTNQLQSLLTSQFLQSNPSLLSYYLNATMLAQLAQQNKPAIDCDSVEMALASENGLNTSLDVPPESPTSSNLYNNHVSLESSSSKVSARQNGTHAKSQEPIPMDASNLFNCKFCGIYFEDAIIHTIHMAHHGFNETFMCNKCGVKCNDRVTFNMHIAQMQHP